MKRTCKERLIVKCIKFGNRYKWCKPLMLVCIVSVMFAFRAFDGFLSNRRRIMGICSVCLVFLVSGSFSLPSFSQGNIPVDSESILDVTAQDMEVYPEDVSDEGSALEELALEELELAACEEGVDKYSVDEILSESQEHQVYGEEEGAEGTAETFSADDWRLLLVNKQHPVPEDYTFTLGTITGSMKCDERIIPDLMAMLQAAKDDGVNLVVCSPYRDLARQEYLFERKIKNYMARGYSYMEAYKISSQAVTVPGASEHQLGLALDIVCDTYTALNEGFGDTKAGKWLEEHSREYGFILRYPKGKEDITGIQFEPWHFRYVGEDAARIIMERGITLEEFVDGISE